VGDAGCLPDVSRVLLKKPRIAKVEKQRTPLALEMVDDDSA
jgi:hypothetical protein